MKTRRRSPRKVLVIFGHPDGAHRHFGQVLGQAYANSAMAAGHDVREIHVGKLDLPLVHSKEEWEGPPRIPAIIDAQHQLAWAEHVAIFYPLWLGSMPAVLKGFFEQVLRPGLVAIGRRRPLRGKSARVTVTMGMPALLYRLYYRAHGVKAFTRNVLALCGIAPVRVSLVGRVEEKDRARRDRWVREMRELGRSAS